jgi:hypothetical protein
MRLRNLTGGLIAEKRAEVAIGKNEIPVSSAYTRGSQRSWQLGMRLHLAGEN